MALTLRSCSSRLSWLPCLWGFWSWWLRLEFGIFPRNPRKQLQAYCYHLKLYVSSVLVCDFRLYSTNIFSCVGILCWPGSFAACCINLMDIAIRWKNKCIDSGPSSFVNRNRHLLSTILLWAHSDHSPVIFAWRILLFDVAIWYCTMSNTMATGFRVLWQHYSHPVQCFGGYEDIHTGIGGARETTGLALRIQS